MVCLFLAYRAHGTLPYRTVLHQPTLTKPRLVRVNLEKESRLSAWVEKKATREGLDQLAVESGLALTTGQVLSR